MGGDFMANKKAVVCDDDSTMRLIIKQILTQTGFDVVEAGNGQEGLGAIRSQKPNLLMLDIDMPVKDGLSVLEDLKKEGKNDTYIIVLSNHEDENTRKLVATFGVQEIWVKPFNAVELNKKIKDLIKEGKL